MSIQLATKALRDARSGLEPGLYSGEDAAVLAEDLAQTEKVVASAGGHGGSRQGMRGAPGEGPRLGQRMDGPYHRGLVGAAQRELETVLALSDLSAQTRAEVEDGTLSLAEAGEIAKTEQPVRAPRLKCATR